MDDKGYFIVTNCEFEFKCPKSWDNLTTTEDSNLRHCQQCNQSVTLCTSQKEYESLVSKGKCIAVDVFQREMHNNIMKYGSKVSRLVGLVKFKQDK